MDFLISKIKNLHISGSGSGSRRDSENTVEKSSNNEMVFLEY